MHRKKPVTEKKFASKKIEKKISFLGTDGHAKAFIFSFG